MTRRESVHDYEAQFFEIFRLALQRPVSIYCASASDAARLRRRLYEFRMALQLERSADPPTAAAAKYLTFRITGTSLTITKRRRQYEIPYPR